MTINRRSHLAKLALRKRQMVGALIVVLGLLLEDVKDHCGLFIACEDQQDTDVQNTIWTCPDLQPGLC